MAEAWTIVSAMRTLVTTSGKTDSTELPEANRCFAAAHTEGLWLDIEKPDAADYRLLEETFKPHPLSTEYIQQQNQQPTTHDYPQYHSLINSQPDRKTDPPPF